MRSIAGLVVALAWLVAAPGARAGEDIYFIDQHTTLVPEHGGTLEQQLLVAMDVQPEGRSGQRMRIRQLWSRARVGGSTHDSLALDPADPNDAALLRVLASGFEASLDRDGRMRTFLPVDAAAWTELEAHNPRAEQLLESMRQATGIAPHRLPRRLSRGQRWSVREDLPGIGEVRWERTVVQLDDDEVLVDLHGQGEGIELRGRQALLRADGMPIEAWLQLATPASDGQPATRSRIYLVNLDHLEGLDPQRDPGYEAILARDLQRPPFTGTAAEAEPLLGLETLAAGELEPWMTSSAQLDAIDPTLVFTIEDDHRASRPLLSIGGQPGGPPDPEGGSRPVRTRLRGVTLLDRDGRALGLDAVPIRRFDRAVMGSQLELSEDQARFPLRLPPDTPAAALEPLDRIRLDVDVTVYEWAGRETVRAGAGHSADGRLAIEWNGRRVTLSGPAAAEEGVWTSAIPLGEDGEPMPYRDMVDWAYDPATEPAAGIRRLDWERRRRPVRIELAAARPIAALELRHYRWGPLRRQWDFRNTGPMDEGGPLVGVHYLAPRPAPPAGEHGAEVLAALRIEPQPHAYPAVLLEGPRVPWARAYCEARSGGEPVGESHLLGSGTDRHGDPDPDAPPRMGWEFLPLWGEEPPPALVATLVCPAATQHQREPVEASRCFHSEGDGWLRIDRSCQARIEAGLVRALDAEGRPLARLPVGARRDAMRFWGEPAAVDYVLRSERLLQRELRLERPW